MMSALRAVRRAGTPALPASRRVVIVITAAFVTVAVLVFRRWLALLIAEVQDAAIAVFINAIEPAAPQRVVIESVVVFRVIVARIAIADVLCGAIDVGEERQAQREGHKSGLDYFPRLFVLRLLRGRRWRLPIEK